VGQYKAAKAAGWHFTRTDMEDAYTGISVHKITVSTDLTF